MKPTKKPREVYPALAQKVPVITNFCIHGYSTSSKIKYAVEEALRIAGYEHEAGHSRDLGKLFVRPDGREVLLRRRRLAKRVPSFVGSHLPVDYMSPCLSEDEMRDTDLFVSYAIHPDTFNNFGRTDLAPYARTAYDTGRYISPEIRPAEMAKEIEKRLREKQKPLEKTFPEPTEKM